MTKRKAALKLVVESHIEEDMEEEDTRDGIEDDSDDEDYNPKHETKKAKSTMELEENPMTKALQKRDQIALRIRSALFAGRMALLNPTQNAIEGVHKFVLKADINASCGIPESDASRELKPYQISGINFLLLLHRLRVGGAFLADDMGLGKSAQTIAFLAVLKKMEGNAGPHLVIAPVTILEQWKEEFAKWCPSFKVVVYYRKGKEDFHKQYDLLVDKEGEPPATLFHILIVGYSIFEKKSAQMKEDRNFLRKWKWNCVIMDEGHLLKDTTSMRTKKLQEILQKAEQRIMLSGTLVQNDLPELWALLSLMMPDTFDAHEKKTLQEFLSMQDQSKDKALATNMKTLLEPFMMRRLKPEVSSQFQPKSNRVLKLDMADDQAQAYEDAKSKWKKHVELKKASEEEDDDSSRSQQIQNAAWIHHEVKSSFIYMRKISNHPLLVRRIYKEEDVQKLAKRFYDLGVFGDQCIEEQVYDKLLSSSDFDLHKLCEKYGGIPNGRGKLDNEVILSATKCQALAKLLAQLKKEGHRCLIFSQWTKILDILECVLSIHNYRFIRLDGSTDGETRQTLVSEYNENQDIFIFLISTKAGGLGLNLTGADTVIIHDVSFNPQSDRQAEDRCHRIGQSKPVTVYRLVTNDTVDRVIYKLAKKKLDLDATVLQTKYDEDEEEEEEIMKEILLEKNTLVNYCNFIENI